MPRPRWGRPWKSPSPGRVFRYATSSAHVTDFRATGTNVNGFAPGLDAVTNRVPMKGRGQQFIRLVIEEQDYRRHDLADGV